MSTRIQVWSGPRNISTALMYSFAQRADTQVFDEPLYAHYLKITGADHPGREETLATMENDGQKVVRDLILAEYEKPVLFFKQMAKHLLALDEAFLAQTVNILLIRDPHLVLNSYAKVIDSPKAEDIGYARQMRIWEVLKQHGQAPVILDGPEVLKNPEKILSQLCERIGIPWDTSMLHWKAGARPEDGVWAKYWYHSVHASTGFAPYQAREVSLPPHLQKVADELMPAYEAMYAEALKA